jgi:hypothetical protein
MDEFYKVQILEVACFIVAFFTYFQLGGLVATTKANLSGIDSIENTMTGVVGYFIQTLLWPITLISLLDKLSINIFNYVLDRYVIPLLFGQAME